MRVDSGHEEGDTQLSGVDLTTEEDRSPARRGLRRLEELLPVVALAAMMVLPLAEIVARRFQAGIPGASSFTQHLTLWVTFLGAALAAREGKLLSLATTSFWKEGPWRRFAEIFAGTVGAGVTALLFRASLELVRVERDFGSTLALEVPVWIAQAVMPVGFALIGLRLAWRASDRWWGRLLGFAGLGVGLWLGQAPGLLDGRTDWPGVILILAATALGSPIFAVLGGFAVLFFMTDGVPLAAVPSETYRLATSPLLAAIPLFTLAGFLLAEGDASRRLVRVFRAWFGFVPGGSAVVCAVVCAFFTVFTGGSGVTILALGGLLFAGLRSEGYREEFSLGLLTASGSLGLLLPPALPLILYGIVAQIPMKELFLGGLIPGLILILLVAGWGVREGVKSSVDRVPFSGREALGAAWEAKWELVLPVVVLVAIFAGWATLVETSALAALFALCTQTFVNRDIRSPRQLFRVFAECVVLLGGVLIILAVAMGLTNYLVDAQVPSRLLEWGQANIDRKIVFLLALNLFLLVVGCLMDIFSAVVVVVPLIAPLGAAFGIDPVHLAVIFIANLELGYMTPPVGLNLFLASYRFDRPLMKIYRAALPYLVLRGVGVLLITYVPWLTTVLIR